MGQPLPVVNIEDPKYHESMLSEMAYSTAQDDDKGERYRQKQVGSGMEKREAKAHVFVIVTFQSAFRGLREIFF